MFKPMRATGFVLTGDRARSLAFYTGVMGFALQAEDGFGATLDMGGLIVRLTDIAGHQPSPHPVLGWEVADIETASSALARKGVVFAQYAGMTEGPFGIWSASDGHVRMNWFADPDGNLLSLMQHD